MTLDRRPVGIATELLEQGINITLPNVSGTPVIDDGKIIDPLTKDVYDIECRTYNGQIQSTTIRLKFADAKTYFDYTLINKTPPQ